MSDCDDLGIRALATALGWTVERFMAWPDAECIEAVRWIRPGTPPGDEDYCPWELGGWGVELPPIPDDVISELRRAV